MSPQPPFDFSTALAQIQTGIPIASTTKVLLNRLTPSEKLSLLDGDAPFYKGLLDLTQTKKYETTPWSHGHIPRLHIPGLQFADGPRGVVLGLATAFPVPTARGATWDTALETQVGRAMGLEARAAGANLLGSTCINAPRHAAWGRVQEVFGEDPMLLGEMGAAHVRGVKDNAIACVKHYALNSMEIARFQVDVQVDESALREVYLPHFRLAVEAGAGCFMTAYNAVNGEWCGQNRMLLDDVLRGEWGFEGVTISDWVFGVRDGVASLRNGLDVEAPFVNLRKRQLPAALENGEISWEVVDKAAFRILSTLLRHYAERETQDPTRDVTLCAGHLRLARDVANRSIVLLKNDPVPGTQHPLLPLPSSVQSCALIGRLSRSANTGDQGSSMVRCPNVITPYDGLKQALPKTCTLTLDNSDEIEPAVYAASNAEVAILIVGYDSADEGEFLAPDPSQFTRLFPPNDGPREATAVSSVFNQENASSVLEGRAAGGDRAPILRLRQRDTDLITAVTTANPRTIIALVTGGTVITEEWRHKCPAILVSWYNGVAGGTALADVLTGTVNPSGRLPWCMPTTHEGDQLPFFDAHAEKIRYEGLFGQRRLDALGVEAAYPLGFGISYTRFALRGLGIAPSETDLESLIVTIDVTNTGAREGRCIVQAYGRLIPARAPQALLGFTPVDLVAGETRAVECRASLRPLQTWREEDGLRVRGDRVAVEVGQFVGDKEGVVGEWKY